MSLNYQIVAQSNARVIALSKRTTSGLDLVPPNPINKLLGHYVMIISQVTQSLVYKSPIVGI